MQNEKKRNCSRGLGGLLDRIGYPQACSSRFLSLGIPMSRFALTPGFPYRWCLLFDFPRQITCPLFRPAPQQRNPTGKCPTLRRHERDTGKSGTHPGRECGIMRVYKGRTQSVLMASSDPVPPLQQTNIPRGRATVSSLCSCPVAHVRQGNSSTP